MLPERQPWSSATVTCALGPHLEPIHQITSLTEFRGSSSVTAPRQAWKRPRPGRRGAGAGAEELAIRV